MRNQVSKQAFDASQEFAGLRKRADVLAYLRIRAIERAQSRNKMRIGQKTNVKDEVRIRRNAIAIAEADDRHEQRPRFRIFEACGDKVAKLVNIELRGVDDQIGEFADRLHQRALVT